MEKKCAMEKNAIRIGYSMFDTCLLTGGFICCVILEIRCLFGGKLRMVMLTLPFSWVTITWPGTTSHPNWYIHPWKFNKIETKKSMVCRCCSVSKRGLLQVPNVRFSREGTSFPVSPAPVLHTNRACSSLHPTTVGSHCLNTWTTKKNGFWFWCVSKHVFSDQENL